MDGSKRKRQRSIYRFNKIHFRFHFSIMAVLYAIEPRALVQAVKRNLERFPEDFMLQLTKQEFTNLKSQFVISSWGGSRTLPYAFTQEGVAMLSREPLIKSCILFIVNCANSVGAALAAMGHRGIHRG